MRSGHWGYQENVADIWGKILLKMKTITLTKKYNIMKKLFFVTLFVLSAFAVSAQLNVVSVSGKQVVDKEDHYLLRFYDGEYQLLGVDYFDNPEVLLALGSSREQATAALTQIAQWFDGAKKGTSMQIKQGSLVFNFTKVSGSEFLVSQGDSNYSQNVYDVLVPALKKYEAFLKDVVCTPYAVAHYNKGDVKQMLKKLSK